MNNIKSLPIASIRRDSGAQFRPSLVDSHVSDIADAIKAKASVPPIIVFFDGALYWMADGDHRIEAHLQVGRTDIESEVREGTQLDARRFGRSANSEHKALKRSPKARRAAVIDALTNDPEWSGWSNVAIAKGCGVDEKFVRQVKNDLGLTSDIRSEERTYTTKHGTIATMKTGNIGKPSKAPATPKLVEIDPADIEPLYNDAEFQAKYPLSILTDNGIKLDGRNAWHAINGALRESDEVDSSVALMLEIYPDGIEGFYSVKVYWQASDEYSCTKEPVPSQMLVAQLEWLGVSLEALRAFRWTNAEMRHSGILQNVIRASVVIGALEANYKDGFEAWWRKYLPFLEAEPVGVMVEIADLFAQNSIEADEGQGVKWSQDEPSAEVIELAQRVYDTTNFPLLWGTINLMLMVGQDAALTYYETGRDVEPIAA